MLIDNPNIFFDTMQLFTLSFVWFFHYEFVYFFVLFRISRWGCADATHSDTNHSDAFTKFTSNELTIFSLSLTFYLHFKFYIFFYLSHRLIERQRERNGEVFRPISHNIPFDRPRSFSRQFFLFLFFSASQRTTFIAIQLLAYTEIICGINSSFF